MGCIEHAKREFLKLGYKPIEQCEDDPDKWIQESVLELLEVFSKQGHSGFSAPYAVQFFTKLALQEPLAPITCTDDEWMDVSDYGGDPDFQNNRCSAVFKNGVDGKPYYLDAIVWKNQHGITYTGSVYDSKRSFLARDKDHRIRSSQFIKLPFTPKTFYVDVIDVEVAKDDWESYIEDINQLEEVYQYYEKPLSLREVRKLKLQKLTS